MCTHVLSSSSNINSPKRSIQLFFLFMGMSCWYLRLASYISLSLLILREASRYPKHPLPCLHFLAENEFKTYIAVSNRSS